MLIPYERAEDINKTLGNLNNILTNHHLETEYTDTKSDLVSHVILKRKNEVVSEGAGKGPFANIGCLAEAIEHMSLLINQDKIKKIRSHDVASQRLLQDDGIISALLKIPNNEIPCVSFKDMKSQKEVYLPYLLVNPSCPKEFNSHPANDFLSRYSSNSGTAFGNSFDEALIHSLNELIERDIVSKFFLDVIENNLSNYESYNLENDTRFEIAGKQKITVVVRRLATHLYFSFAYGAIDGMPMANVGSGVSTSLKHAIERSIFEYNQSNVLYNEELLNEDILVIDFLKKSIQLSKLITLASTLNKSSLSLSELHLDDGNLSIEEQLKVIKSYVADVLGVHSILTRTITDYNSNGIVIQSYIPSLERFNLIRSGSLVVPQGVLKQ